MKRQRSVFEKHAARIARETLRMPDPIAAVMGGPTKAEAKRFLEEERIVWADLSPREQQHEIKLYSRKYGLNAYQAREFAKLVGVGREEIEEALEDWRRSVGYPATDSPLTRGVVLDIITGCHDPSKIRRGCR